MHKIVGNEEYMLPSLKIYNLLNVRKQGLNQFEWMGQIYRECRFECYLHNSGNSFSGVVKIKLFTAWEQILEERLASERR